MTEEAANFIPISEVCDTPVHYGPRIILQFERSISYTRFQCYWPFVMENPPMTAHRWIPHHKGPVTEALMFYLTLNITIEFPADQRGESPVILDVTAFT